MKNLCLFLSLCAGLFVVLPAFVDAATYNVCATCEHTTITSARSAATTPGDIINVQSTYSAAGETYPLGLFTANTTLTCEAGATIGQTTPDGDNTFQLTTSSTVTGCTFSNIQLYTGSDTYRSGITITDNSFVAAVTSTIAFSSSIGYTTIARNTNLDTIRLASTSTNTTIEGNTFYGDGSAIGSGVLMSVEATSTNLAVQENYFESRITSLPDTNFKLIDIASNGLTFVTNTVRYIEEPPAGAIAGTIQLQLDGGATHVISGNKIESAPNLPTADSCFAVQMFPLSDMVQDISVIFHQNTFRNRCGAGAVLELGTGGKTAAINTYVSSTKNIFNGEGESTCWAMQFDQGNGSMTGTIDQNLVYGSFAGNIQNVDDTNVGEGASYYTFNPHLQIADVSTSNDLDVADFSLALDIDGAGGKIGASTTTRRTTIYVDDDGTIDYSTVDATSLGAVSSMLRSGDTLSVAAGSYGSFSLNSAFATTSLSLVGAGVGTVISADTNQDAMSLSGVTSTSVSGFVLQNASSQTGYTSTLMNFTYGGNSYADAIGALLIPGNTTIFANSGDFDYTLVIADEGSLSGVTGIGEEDYHLALINVQGERGTFLIPNSVASSYVEASAMCGENCTVDQFVTSTFSVSGGVYTYNAAAVAAAEVTLNEGLSAPSIAQTATLYSGIKLTNSGGITITNVTSTGNSYGIWFASGGGNRIYDSVLSSNSAYDIRQDATATNTIDNVTFTRASSTVAVTAAPVLVKFSARALVTRASNAATKISGSTVTATDAAAGATSLGATDADGYTSYTRLPAYTITNASAELTNGGYNAYTFGASAVSGYDATSTSVTLSSRNQTVTLGAYSNTPPTAPSSAAAGSITATTTAFTWTDNSSDETGFTINYVTSSLGETFANADGTTSTTSAGITSATFSLYPNMEYRFRVAAVGEGATSAYSTSSIFRTLAAIPDAPTLTATGRTTATLVMNANGNSTSTEFALYSSTLGAYVTSTGSTASSAYWATTSTWSAITISGLTCNTAYSFIALARNGDSVETVSSTAASVTTSACETVSSGGGGGGGVGASGSVSIPLPITTPAPVTTPPVVLPPIIVADIPRVPVSTLPTPTNEASLPPAAPATVRLVQGDARAFAVTLRPVDQERLASFIDTGTTRETRALGSGERRALVRDALQTMGRSDVSLADLERMARGEIPSMRNLTREREQLPRVRATFRRLYNRDPNFKNAEENLVWNTMMYRIRFTRDLAAEREGIQDFRRAFNRAPSDPFQWAVVRALGYVL